MPEAPADKITPMLRQYLEIKSRYADALVLFQMGDFYEMFFEDAEKGAGALNIVLTSRSRQGEERIPMAGFPIHAAQSYISRLLDQGFKVVVCDQVEDPAQAKGLVRREKGELQALVHASNALQFVRGVGWVCPSCRQIRRRKNG